MTANTMQGDREKALEAGMDDHVPKPVKSGELEAVLRRWLLKEAGEEPLERDARLAVSVKDAKLEDVDDPLHRETLEGLRELGGSELLSDLGEVFSGDTPPRLATLRAAVEGGDADTVERVAHTLAGSSANMGARRMAAICRELQVMGASKDLSKAPVILEQLQEEFGRVRRALAAEV